MPITAIRIENIYHDLRYARAVLRDWETFFFILGSSAAALTGLQFVVVALGAQVSAVRDPEAVEAFGSPTIVHLCVVLTVSLLTTVPAHTPATLGSAFVLIGAGGAVYGVITARRARRQTNYQPVFEDWLWHIALPIAAYVMLLVTGIAAYWHLAGAIYFAAGFALLLLLIAIHNAWDSAVYISTHGARED